MINRYEATQVIYSKYYFYAGENNTTTPAFADILNSWDNSLPLTVNTVDKTQVTSQGHLQWV